MPRLLKLLVPGMALGISLLLLARSLTPASLYV